LQSYGPPKQYTGRLAAGALVGTNFDFLRDGLAFSSVSRVLWLPFIFLLDKAVLVGLRFPATGGCRPDQKVAENLAAIALTNLTTNFGQHDSKAILPL